MARANREPQRPLRLTFGPPHSGFLPTNNPPGAVSGAASVRQGPTCGTAGSDVPHQVGWRVTTPVADGVSQLPRVAWYVGHGLAVRRLFEAAQQRDGKKAQPSAHTNLPAPDDGMRVLLD